MRTILVVEDSLTEAELITRYLQQAGLSVISVSSGEEAQTRVLQQRPDLILLDVILPGQSGFELCRELKTDPGTSQIPVVLCSTKNTEVDKMWGNMLGADAYLAKPVDQQALVQTIQQLIAR
ncbi:MAG: response regulator [Aphanocapsa sp. GSE-SYN-MK-11-07L]|jgi:CheY-like chemotaxis protein|nr:response regulator [Aphanocapsa sp. GSE-SYN-MK-11-07L]